MNTTDTRTTVMLLLSLARRAIRYELNIWRSLFRWILRRPDTGGPGDTAFSYAGVVTPILMAFIVLSAVEIPIFDLILSRTLPWPTVRQTALVLGVWGLLWMIGLLASLRVHPHLVRPAGLRVRNSATIDISLPWTAIADVRTDQRSFERSRTVQFEQTDQGEVLNLVTGKQTNITLSLRAPVSVRLPAGASPPIRELRFYADEPRELTALIRQHLATAGAETGSAAAVNDAAARSATPGEYASRPGSAPTQRGTGWR